MRPRSPARWLAPVALVACLVAVLRVLDDGMRPDGGSAPAEQRPAARGAQTTAVSARRPEKRRRRAQRRTYTVRAGDTLTTISARTGVSLERLQRLNPQLDSRMLQTGQRVKLSP